ncbi:MAG TPA: aminotransferase class V-fold PLP-dependent enzyme [Puia sp.]|nr:aminotransferase class V-fold PLP-dependent enzyme [Puia sp.]
MNKRTFIKGMALAGLTAPAGLVTMAERISRFSGRSAGELAGEEEFWSGVRNGYRLKPDYVNLENGYYNIQPGEILEAFLQHVRDINYEGAYYMRTVQFDRKRAIAARLAALGGCSPDDLIITRNTTESLDMIISGYPWKAGDEAIMALQDYGSMLKMFQEVERRYGVVRKLVSVPNQPAGDDEVVAVYEKAITRRTRLLMVSHMINVTGQILPIRKIVDMAHARGVEVMVDAAHSYAHFRHTIPELDCDYYGSSLHKWLSAPLGAGILFVKKEKVKKIWPLLAEPDDTATGIATLNHTGTLPVHTDLAVANALDYYSALGPERKEARLRYLQQYWTSKARELPGVIINTPSNPQRTCAIANVAIRGMKPAEMAAKLLDKYKIYTVAIDMPEAQVMGCRVTPNIFTMPEELDRLVNALQEMGAKA